MLQDQENKKMIDYLLKLPARCIACVDESIKGIVTVSDTIRTTKQHAVMREIGKTMNRLYAIKGELRGSILEMDSDTSENDVEQIKKGFGFAAHGIDDLLNLVKDRDFGSMSLSTEASAKLALAKSKFENLSRMPNERILANPEEAQEINSFIIEMMAQGDVMIKRLDKRRETLDKI